MVNLVVFTVNHLADDLGQLHGRHPPFHWAK